MSSISAKKNESLESGPPRVSTRGLIPITSWGNNRANN